MSNTTFSGPITSEGGFIGPVTSETLEVTGDATLSGTANVIIIPTTDPEVEGAIWYDVDTLKVSTGA